VYYTLSTGASLPQVSLHQYQRAIDTAIQFARQHYVRAWFADGDSLPTLLKQPMRGSNA
jgi:hypothetical protein